MSKCNACLLMSLLFFGNMIGLIVLGTEDASANMGAWTTKPAMPTAREGPAYGVFANKVYIIGGSTGSGTNVNEMYDPIANNWTNMAAMPSVRAYMGTGIVNNKFYVIGGYTAGKSYNTQNEEYNPENNTWTTKAPLSKAKNMVGVGVVNNKVYVIGGVLGGPGSEQETSEVEVYDPGSNTWATMAPMPTARHGMGVAVVNGKIYAMAGFANGSVVNANEMYDPASNTWVKKEPVPTGRAFPGTAVFGSKIYIFGGGTTTTALSVNEVYDTIADSWSTATPMTYGRGCFGVGIVFNKVYAIGGSFGQLRLGTNEEYDPTAGATEHWPKVTITAPANGVTLYKNNVTVSGTASDDVGVAKVEVSRDNKTWQRAAGTTQWTTQMDLTWGTFKIYARATNTDGFKAVTSITVTIKKFELVINVTSIKNGATINTTHLDLAGTAYDPAGIYAVSVCLDNRTWIPAGAETWHISLNLSAGTNIIYIQMHTRADQFANTSITVYVTDLDTEKPTIKIDSPKNKATVSSKTVTVRGTAWDNRNLKSVDISTDGVVWIPCQGTAMWDGTLNLKEGKNTIYAEATDEAGNTQVTSITVTVKTTTPGFEAGLLVLAVVAVVALMGKRARP